MRSATIAAAAVLAAAAVAVAPAVAATPVLRGTVGPGFTITLTKGGKSVKTLARGRYKLVVADKSSIHNFELEGPGIGELETDVSETGTSAFTVTLKKVKYVFYCKPHRTTMRGSFVVR